MALSLDEVRRIAHLARIEITPAEAADVRAKLERIFELIGVMRAVDTTGIVPMSHAQDVVLPLREDRITETDRHVIYQQGAPAVEDGLYLVPKVIE
jgi:aspartyl-tRNA(Asn)/glutamyl-tRNA(Gln) amidotransferase subunit C